MDRGELTSKIKYTFISFHVLFECACFNRSIEFLRAPHLLLIQSSCRHTWRDLIHKDAYLVSVIVFVISPRDSELRSKYVVMRVALEDRLLSHRYHLLRRSQCFITHHCSDFKWPSLLLERCYLSLHKHALTQIRHAGFRNMRKPSVRRSLCQTTSLAHRGCRPLMVRSTKCDVSSSCSMFVFYSRRIWQQQRGVSDARDALAEKWRRPRQLWPTACLRRSL